MKHLTSKKILFLISLSHINTMGKFAEFEISSKGVGAKR